MRDVPHPEAALARGAGEEARVGREGAGPVLARGSERVHEVSGVVVPDLEGLVPGHGGEEFVVGAEANPHDGVAVAGEGEADGVGAGVVDADVPFVVTVCVGTVSGEENQARACRVEDLAAEGVDETPVYARVGASLGFDVQRRDCFFDIGC